MHLTGMLQNDGFVVKFQDKQMWVVILFWSQLFWDPREKLLCTLASQTMPRQKV